MGGRRTNVTQTAVQHMIHEFLSLSLDTLLKFRSTAAEPSRIMRTSGKGKGRGKVKGQCERLAVGLDLVAIEDGPG